MEKLLARGKETLARGGALYEVSGRAQIEQAETQKEAATMANAEKLTEETGAASTQTA